MIEPVRSGVELIEEIRASWPDPGSLHVWWLGQSGFLFKSREAMLAVDLYLSEYLTRKYEDTARPHVRMTRAPLRGGDLRGVSLILASHKHSDHLDPITMIDLMDASPTAFLIVPEAFTGYARELGLPPGRIAGIDDGGVIERAGFRVRAIPSAHEGLDTDAAGHHLYLGFVIEAEGLRLYHSGDSLAYDGLAERLGDRPFDVLFLPINGRDPARGVPGNMSAAEAVDLAARVRPRYVVPHHYDMFTFNTVPVEAFASEARRLPPGSSPGSSAAGSAGRSRRERHARHRHRDLRDQDPGHRRAGDDPGLGDGRVSLRPPPARLVRAASRTLVAGDVRPSRGCWPRGRSDPEDVAGIGLSGQMHGSVFLDEAGEVIRPALLWNDQRTAEECREIEQKAGGREALIRMVANPALTGFTAPKVLWVRRHEPRNWERVRQVLLPKDYVRYRLTGTYATEVSDASGTLLLDVANRRWSRELLDKLQLDPALVAAVLREPGGLRPGERHRGRGDRAEGRDAGGRRRRRPAGRGGRQRDRPPGRGLGDDGDLGGRLRPRRPARLRPARAGSSAGVMRCRARGTSWASCWPPGAASSGSATSWARPRSPLARQRGEDPYFLLTDEAALAGPGAEGLFFLPYLTGERTPALRPRCQGRLDRPDRPARPAAPDPQRARGRHLRHARQPRIDPRDGRGDRAGADLRRRRPQPTLATDPGRHLRLRRPHAQLERGAGLRRRPAGPGGHRRLLLGARSVRRHHPIGGFDSARSQGQVVL